MFSEYSPQVLDVRRPRDGCVEYGGISWNADSKFKRGFVDAVLTAGDCFPDPGKPVDANGD